MLNKFFQSFNEKKDKNDDHSFESDLYNLIYEIIIADHEISEQEINFSSVSKTLMLTFLGMSIKLK